MITATSFNQRASTLLKQIPQQAPSDVQNQRVEAAFECLQQEFPADPQLNFVKISQALAQDATYLGDAYHIRKLGLRAAAQGSQPASPAFSKLALNISACSET